MKRMKRNIRIKYLFVRKETKITYDKKIYIKSDWNPLTASANMENKLIRFEQ